jgi:NAD-dependent DNA ligase
VGQHLAIDIAERFRTFPRFYTASVEDLAEVKGVGKVMARRIVDHFHDDTDTISDPFNPEFNPFK